MADIADEIRKQAEGILQQSPRNVSAALTTALRPFLVDPYRVGPVIVSELYAKDASREVAVYTGGEEANADTPRVSAGNIAAVFHCAETLTADELRKGYESIGAVKRIEHHAPPEPGSSLNNATMGVIFCLDSQDSLDAVAEAISDLNRRFPSREWPDAIVILKKGALNYAVQFEGDRIKGDFFLPTATGFPVMPMYIHLVGRATGVNTLNWLFGLLFMHLQIFTKGVEKLPERDKVCPPPIVMTFMGYQFNLRWELVPVPEEMRTDKGAGLRNMPYRIETQRGELLSHVQFVPWQEGGAIRIWGKMPIETVLVFLGPVISGAQFIPQETGRISSVLRITKQDFLNALMRLQAQSNMIVKPEQPSWIVSKIAGEGSRSAFIARLHLGVLGIRDKAITDQKKRDAFDNAYESTLIALTDARTTAQEIKTLVDGHRSKVSAGEAARVQGKAIHVDGIDKELRKHTADFLTSAGRAIKQGMQSVAKNLGLEIGFFFKDTKQFEKGIAKLQPTHPDLATYLTEARQWSERLQSVRNKLEHEGWTLPRVNYVGNSGKIEMVEPDVAGEPVSQFVDHVLDRLCCFCEEVTMYGLQAQFDPVVALTEIPRAKRDAAAPERFRPTLAMGGGAVWKLLYHAATFDEV